MSVVNSHQKRERGPEAETGFVCKSTIEIFMMLDDKELDIFR